MLFRHITFPRIMANTQDITRISDAGRTSLCTPPFLRSSRL